jgi:hypothetical protein
MSQSRVTDAIMARGLELGLTPDRIEFLMKVADVPNFNKIDPNRKDGYEIFKPDPDGVFYLKASVSGKWIVKPLHTDEAKSKAMLPNKLKEVGLQ